MRSIQLSLSTFLPASLLALTLSAFGCGGIAVIDGDGQGGASSASSNVGSVSSSSGGPSALEITLIEALGGANCQPAIPPDPLRIDFLLQMNNSLGSSNAAVSVEAARVASVKGVTSFTTDPANVIISAGANQDVAVSKVDGSGSGTNGCDYCNATDLQLQLELTVDGNPVDLSGPVNSMSCVF